MLNKLALPGYFGRLRTLLKWEISATWTRKTEALKYGAQFQRITVEFKERTEHRIRQSDLPTKPPTDRHSTNLTKEHKSLKSLSSVKLLMLRFLL